VLPTFIGLPKIEFKWTSSKGTILQFDWQNFPQILAILAAIVLIVLGLLRLRQQHGKSPWTFLALGIILGLIGIFGRSILPKLGMMEEMHGFNLATLGIIFAAIWQCSGYTMALYLAGLQSVPQDLAEAARLDGATELQYYTHIAIPMLKPITISAVIILSHISLKMFDLIFAMTGPDNAATGHPALNMYLTTFRANNFAKGASIAVVLFLLAATFIIPYMISSYKERKV
jgi:glucose/mannose transport system permease protein